MTFSQWYSTNIEPGVIQNANQIPDPEQRALIMRAARESMAACWNAAQEDGVVAMQDVSKAIRQYYGDALPSHLAEFIAGKLLMLRNARVKP